MEDDFKEQLYELNYEIKLLRQEISKVLDQLREMGLLEKDNCSGDLDE